MQKKSVPEKFSSISVIWLRIRTIFEWIYCRSATHYYDYGNINFAVEKRTDQTWHRYLCEISFYSSKSQSIYGLFQNEFTVNDMKFHALQIFPRYSHGLRFQANCSTKFVNIFNQNWIKIETKLFRKKNGSEWTKNEN